MIGLGAPTITLSNAKTTTEEERIAVFTCALTISRRFKYGLAPPKKTKWAWLLLSGNFLIQAQLAERFDRRAQELEIRLTRVLAAQDDENRPGKTPEGSGHYPNCCAAKRPSSANSATPEPISVADAHAFPIARNTHPAASTLSDLSTRATPQKPNLTHWPASKNLRQSCRSKPGDRSPLPVKLSMLPSKYSTADQKVPLLT